MEGGRFLSRKDRETLRERWLLRAGQAFERMFAEANQDQLITFTEREDLACDLGQELARLPLGRARSHRSPDASIPEAAASVSQVPAARTATHPSKRATSRTGTDDAGGRDPATA